MSVPAVAVPQALLLLPLRLRQLRRRLWGWCGFLLLPAAASAPLIIASPSLPTSHILLLVAAAMAAVGVLRGVLLMQLWRSLVPPWGVLLHAAPRLLLRGRHRMVLLLLLSRMLPTWVKDQQVARVAAAHAVDIHWWRRQ